MSRRRFFVSEVQQGGAVLKGDEAHHLTRVLRVEVGQKYELTDGTRAYLAEVAGVRKDLVEFRILEAVPASAAIVRVSLLMALIKFDHFELLIEKATEMGAAEIVPVITARTEVGLQKAVPKRLQRWDRIALEASQQSRRDSLPKLWPAVQFDAALRWDRRYRYWLDEEAGGESLLNVAPADRRIEDTVGLLIGPEGGWTAAEREAAVREGWTRLSLGPQVLRAETAALASLAIVGALWQSARQ